MFMLIARAANRNIGEVRKNMAAFLLVLVALIWGVSLADIRVLGAFAEQNIEYGENYHLEPCWRRDNGCRDCSLLARNSATGKVICLPKGSPPRHVIEEAMREQLKPMERRLSTSGDSIGGGAFGWEYPEQEGKQRRQEDREMDRIGQLVTDLLEKGNVIRLANTGNDFIPDEELSIRQFRGDCDASSDSNNCVPTHTRVRDSLNEQRGELSLDSGASLMDHFSMVDDDQMLELANVVSRSQTRREAPIYKVKFFNGNSVGIKRTSLEAKQPQHTAHKMKSNWPPIRLHRSDLSGGKLISIRTIPNDGVDADGGTSAASGPDESNGSNSSLESFSLGAGFSNVNRKLGSYDPKQESSGTECKTRSFTFMAVKSDGNGNKCWGPIAANVCYGGCDTGEISDWLFPHKKTIHKVCMHNRRIKRTTLLAKCNIPNAGEGLRQYTYVDALDCACQKCSTTETTCLGSLTEPMLPNSQAWQFNPDGTPSITY